eukprot:scaffold62039_cov31-Cyclotella_meneghiniana.AAC.1
MKILDNKTARLRKIRILTADIKPNNILDWRLTSTMTSVINRCLIAGLFIVSLTVCSGEHNSSSNGGGVSSASIDLQINTNRIASNGVALSSSSHESWWKGAVAVLMNHRTKRKLGSTVNHVDKPHFIPDIIDKHEHRFLEFGDYADPTFNCPATTTCPIVCVNAVTDCPSDATCALANPDNSDHEFELCVDGTCADLTLNETCDPSLESPCTCSGFEFTCAKQIDLYNS